MKWKSLHILHLMPLKFLFKLALQKKKIEINPENWDIEYGIKKYKVNSELIYFPVASIKDKTNSSIKVDIIIFEKIKSQKYYDTSILNVIN